MAQWKARRENEIKESNAIYRMRKLKSSLIKGVKKFEKDVKQEYRQA